VSDEHGDTDAVIDTKTNALLTSVPLGGGAGNTVYDSGVFSFRVGDALRPELRSAIALSCLSNTHQKRFDGSTGALLNASNAAREDQGGAHCMPLEVCSADWRCCCSCTWRSSQSRTDSGRGSSTEHIRQRFHFNITECFAKYPFPTFIQSIATAGLHHSSKQALHRLDPLQL
jgi:hypothetical protein